MQKKILTYLSRRLVIDESKKWFTLTLVGHVHAFEPFSAEEGLHAMLDFLGKPYTAIPTNANENVKLALQLVTSYRPIPLAMAMIHGFILTNASTLADFLIRVMSRESLDVQAALRTTTLVSSMSTR